MNEELKSVREVCKKTGLNRKLLFDYKDIVKPTAFSNGADGYKLYSDDDIIKLQHIAIFRSIGISRSKIKEIMLDENLDSISICNQQLDLLNNKKKEIEDQIALVEQLKIIGFKSRTANTLREIYQNSLQTKFHLSDFLKVFDKVYYDVGFEDYIDSHFDKIYDDLFEDYNIIKSFLTLYNAIKKRNIKKTKNTLCNVHDYFLVNYGLTGIMILYSLSILPELEGLDDDVYKYFDDVVLKKLLSEVQKFLFNSYDKKFDNISAYLVRLRKYYKIGIEDSRLNVEFNKFINYLIKTWGIQRNEEYSLVTKLIISFEDNSEYSNLLSLLFLQNSPFSNN